MHTVYILKSLKAPGRIYIGCTTDLERRVEQHNHGRSEYTKHFMPWRVETEIIFADIELARRFETYLKSGSGHAFLWKHLVNK